MISALFYLQYHSVVNRLHARLMRLKQPKYIVGALVGAAYFYMYFVRALFFHGSGRVTHFPEEADSIGALILMVIVVLGWIFWNDRGGIYFTEAEIAFLFPAPVSRKTLIQYKLIRSQFTILFSTLLLTLVTGRWFNGWHVIITILGWWVILSALNLHRMAFTLMRARLFDSGLTALRWRAAVILGALLSALGVLAWGWQSLPAMEPGGGVNPDALLAWFKGALVSGPAPYLLYPFKLVVRPYLAPGGGAFLIAIGPAFAILAANYVLAILSNFAFEEASLDYSQKVADRIATARANQGPGTVRPKKAKRNPFRLRPTGPAPVALLWKNLLQTSHIFTLRFGIFLTIILAASLSGIGKAAFHGTSASDAPPVLPIGIATTAVTIFAMSFVIGPAFLRQDLRSDLERADMLKLYPLRGWQIVLGEMLAPVAILTALQWALIVIMALIAAGFLVAAPLSESGKMADVVSQSKIALLAKGAVVAACCAVGALALNFLFLLVPNAMALLFPGWVRFNKDAPRGFEVAGQRIVLMLGQLFVVALALLPVALVSGGVFFLGNLLIGPVAGGAAAVILGVIIIAGEIATAIYFLGELFEHTDLVRETATA